MTANPAPLQVNATLDTVQLNQVYAVQVRAMQIVKVVQVAVAQR